FKPGTSEVYPLSASHKLIVVDRYVKAPSGICVKAQLAIHGIIMGESHIVYVTANAERAPIVAIKDFIIYYGSTEIGAALVGDAVTPNRYSCAVSWPCKIIEFTVLYRELRVGRVAAGYL